MPYEFGIRDLKERVDSLGYQLASALGDLEGLYYEREAEDEKAVTISRKPFPRGF